MYSTTFIKIFLSKNQFCPNLDEKIFKFTNKTETKLEKLDYQDRIIGFFLFVNTPTNITPIPIEMINISAGIRIAAT